MAKKLKFGNVILCDHVVSGEQNKTTLINVYSGDIVLSEMPATFWLGFYCEHYPNTTDAVEINISVKLDKMQIARITGQVQANFVGEVGQITIPLFPIRVARDTVISITASADGYQSSEILKKRIFLVNGDQASTSSLPHSEQLQPAPQA